MDHCPNSPRSPTIADLQLMISGDLVIVDQNTTTQITDEDQLSRAGWTPFAGLAMAGRMDRVILRGQTICVNGQVADTQVGQFVKP